MLFGEKYHRWIYIFGLFMMAIGLPLGKFLIGIGLFTVGINWLLETAPGLTPAIYFPNPRWRKTGSLWLEKMRTRWNYLRARPSVLILAGILLLHLIGASWATDQHEAWKDIRIKLPLFVLPLVIGTTRPLEKKIFEILLFVFTAAVIISSISTVLIANELIIPKKPVNDLRDASVFVSLLRLALMSVLSIFLFGRWLIREKKWLPRTGCLVAMVWLTWFLLYMQSLTGIVILFAGGFFLLVMLAAHHKRKKLVTVLSLFFLAFTIGAGVVIKNAYDEFYNFHPVSATLEKKSPRGALYLHAPENGMVENGHPVMVYICWHELDSVWNKRSAIPLNGGSDKKGNAVAATLLRYMASKGLRKDADGLSQLAAGEIHAIENGETNALNAQRTPIGRRLYQVFWELYHFRQGQNPSGHSVSMRLVLANTAIGCIKEKPLTGFGTGGQKAAFVRHYEKNGDSIDEKFQWLHAHNQFLAIGVTLGIPALLYFLFSLWYPAKNMNRWGNYLYLAFFITFFLSCFDDDTLETMQGVIFFAFFNSLLLFAMPVENENSTHHANKGDKADMLKESNAAIVS